jgi:hypothetical protein
MEINKRIIISSATIWFYHQITDNPNIPVLRINLVTHIAYTAGPEWGRKQ